MNGADVIPLMTHSYGKYWKQPATSEIEIEERYAVMGKETFEKLLDYSCSIPSGAYEGKMWRRENGAYDLEFVQGVGKPEWWLCWYDVSDKPDCVSVQHRIIKIREETGEG